MSKELKSLISSHRLIHIKTKHPDSTAFDCIPLVQSKSLVIFQEITAFEPDGIVVLPKRWILGIRNGQIERAADAVIRHDRTINELSGRSVQFGQPKNLLELLSHLRSRGTWPAIEILRNNKGIIYIGPITSVSDKTFRIHCYSASGEWVDESEFEYRNVFKVEIESRYTAHFNSYMRTKSLPEIATNKEKK